jgi:DNA-directed RNA polymerase sigma subunit (sigma70/sigma32)
MAALGNRNQQNLPREVRDHFAGEEPSCDPSVIGPLLRASRHWHGATDYDCGVVAQVATHTDSSLDETWDHREGVDAPSAKVPLVETVPDLRSEDPSRYWEENRDAERVVRKALGWMTEREREICLARVLDVDTDTTLDDFGERWGVTRQRVQQIEAGVVAKLKRAWKIVHGA